MVTAVTSQTLIVQDAGPAGPARALPEQPALSGAEQHPLSDWLDRLASAG